MCHSNMKYLKNYKLIHTYKSLPILECLTNAKNIKNKYIKNFIFISHNITEPELQQCQSKKQIVKI